MGQRSGIGGSNLPEYAEEGAYILIKGSLAEAQSSLSGRDSPLELEAVAAAFSMSFEALAKELSSFVALAKKLDLSFLYRDQQSDDLTRN